MARPAVIALVVIACSTGALGLSWVTKADTGSDAVETLGHADKVDCAGSPDHERPGFTVPASGPTTNCRTYADLPVVASAPICTFMTITLPFELEGATVGAYIHPLDGESDTLSGYTEAGEGNTFRLAMPAHRYAWQHGDPDPPPPAPGDYGVRAGAVWEDHTLAEWAFRITVEAGPPGPDCPSQGGRA